MEISIQIDIGKALDGLDAPTFGKVVNQGLTRSAIHLESVVKRNMSDHVVTGKTRASVTHRISGGQAFIGSNDPVLRFLEEGTRPHIITPRTRKVLAWPKSGFSAAGLGRGPQGTLKGTGALAFAKRVRHPGTKAYRFLANTAKDEEGRVVSLFVDAVKQYIH